MDIPPLQVDLVEAAVVPVSDKSSWYFVRVIDRSGVVGIGEATLNGWESMLDIAVETIADSLAGIALALPEQIHARFPDQTPGRVFTSVLSAVEQALWDVAAQKSGVPIWALWSANPLPAISFYANINRGVADRSVNGWLEAMMIAEAAGFSACKLAPFDGIRITDPCSADFSSLQPKLRLLQTLGDQQNVGHRLMVDCHWRFSGASADYVVSALLDAGALWIEAPVPESWPNIPHLASLRTKVESRGSLLAGAEMQFGPEEFGPYLDRGAFSTILPDLRWCGGPTAAHRIVDLARASGSSVAPHNSAGPVLAAHTVHLCLAARLETAELQFRETPLFTDILADNSLGIGAAIVSKPQMAGLGIVVDPSLFTRKSRSRVKSLIGIPGAGAFS